jgi:hypothetical protein
MTNCDHMSRKSEWYPETDTEYRDNLDTGRRQSKVKVNYYCPCGELMKAEVARDWTNV